MHLKQTTSLILLLLLILSCSPPPSPAPALPTGVTSTPTAASHTPTLSSGFTSTPTADTMQPPAPAYSVTTFQPDDSTFIPNPERGFHESVGLEETSLDWYAAQGYTLAYTDLGKLDAYRDRDLPPEYLNALPAHFQLARNAGIKLIVRFSYNDGPIPVPDAPLAQVLRHIQQLAPVLEANKDVIAWFEAGFIGAWGEWHSSMNGLDSPENKIIIRDALLENFPSDRFIVFRYPGDFTAWYPQPLTEAQAFTQMPQARVGHHNDCFLASNYDGATYLLQPDYETVMFDEWQAYIAQMGRFVPVSGETCELNPPRTDCANALQEMERLHWTALNEAWNPDVIQSWKDQGCYAEIHNRLGYRLSLLEMAASPTVRQGSEFEIQIKLQNTGFASPLLPRPVYIVLIKDGAAAYEQLVPVDPRRWEPGQHTFTASIALPADLPAGHYQIALWLPDPAPTLRDDPRYAIRFANQNIWDAEHGWNVLGALTIQE